MTILLLFPPNKVKFVKFSQNFFYLPANLFIEFSYFHQTLDWATISKTLIHIFLCLQSGRIKLRIHLFELLFSIAKWKSIPWILISVESTSSPTGNCIFFSSIRSAVFNQTDDEIAIVKKGNWKRVHCRTLNINPPKLNELSPLETIQTLSIKKEAAENLTSISLRALGRVGWKS